MTSPWRILVVALVTLAGAASELKVDVYEGPTECEDKDRVSKGRHLSMHYTGTIDESSATGKPGRRFDSSRDRGQTFDFVIGTGQVIPGWDRGLMGLCLGAKATLVIPPEMGYGRSGAGDDIPGGATLRFDVEVVGITDGPTMAANLFKEIDADYDGKLSKDELGVFFSKQGRDVPDELWEREDKDKDGFISWAEFSGPKGGNPGGDEL